MAQTHPTTRRLPAGPTLAERLDAAWRRWVRGTPPPAWAAFAAETDRADDLLALLQTDIEYRVKAHLPALLAEPYPLPQLGAPQRLELIRWEYQQRWKNGQCVQRAEYLAAFPELAGEVAGLRPRWTCPACRQTGIPLLDEAVEELACPRCGTWHAITLIFKARDTQFGLASSDTQGQEPPATLHTGQVAADAQGTPQLPGYEILGTLGKGGMGVVYQARQQSLNRIVALKYLRSDCGSEEEMARLRIEAEAAAQLQHPGIAQVFEVGSHAGRPYLTLEYAAGGSLEKVLAGTPQPPRTAALIAESVARAMHFAHHHGIIHRDLKPANLLLVPKLASSSDSGSSNPTNELPWQLKITDFGLAKRFSEESQRTQQGTLLGTPSYMAPEQARGERQLGPATDVYAIGAILYECLTGRPPFRAPNPWETIDQVLHEEPVPPRRLQPGTPLDLETICLKCLNKQSARRYASAAELADDLGRFLRHEAIQARPVGLVERLRQWTRRNPREAAWIGTAATLLLVGLITAIVLWRLADSRRVDLENANRQIKKERDAAEQNAERARAVVNEAFTLAAEHPYFQADGMTPGRRLLLETAQRHLAEFIEQRQNDRALLAQVADARARLGHVRKHLGHMQEARASFTAALRDYDQLVQIEPNNPRFPVRQAELRIELAVLDADSGQSPTAIASLKQAIATLAALLERQPEHADARFQLAYAWRRLATILAGNQQVDEAAKAIQQSLELTRSLQTKGEAAPVRVREQEAVCWTTLGKLQLSRGQVAAAEQAFRRALPLRRSLVAENPSPMARRELAVLLGSLGLALEEAGHLEEARKLQTEAVALREQLAAGSPDIAIFQTDLAVSYISVARSLSRPEELDQQIHLLEKAAKLCRQQAEAEPSRLDNHRRLGECCYNLHYSYRKKGATAEATASLAAARRAWEEVVKRAPGVPAHQALVASVIVSQAEMARNAKMYPEAVAAYQEARRRYVAIERQLPGVPEHTRDRLRIDMNLSYILEQVGDLEGSVELLCRVLPQRAELTIRYPKVQAFQRDVENTRLNLAAAVQTMTRIRLAEASKLSPRERAMLLRDSQRLAVLAAWLCPEKPVIAEQAELLNQALRSGRVSGR